MIQPSQTIHKVLSSKYNIGLRLRSDFLQCLGYHMSLLTYPRGLLSSLVCQHNYVWFLPKEVPSER